MTPGTLSIPCFARALDTVTAPMHRRKVQGGIVNFEVLGADGSPFSYREVLPQFIAPLPSLLPIP